MCGMKERLRGVWLLVNVASCECSILCLWHLVTALSTPLRTLLTGSRLYGLVSCHVSTHSSHAFTDSWS